MNKNITEALWEYNRIYKEFNDIYHTIAKRLGLSDSAFDILYAVYVLGEGCKQKDICGYSCTSKTTINSSIQKLEREGILRVERGKVRETQVFLTPAGRTLVEEKISQVVAAEERAIRGTDPYMRFVVRGLMDEFAEKLRLEIEDLQ